MAGLREALDGAYDELDAGDVVDVAGGDQVEAEPAGTSEVADAGGVEQASGEPEGDRPRDESGRFTKEPVAAVRGTPPARPSVSGAQAGVDVAAPGGPAAGGAPAAPPASVFKAPQSWKASVRELAAKLPAEFHPILEESLRRDKEAAQALQQRAEAMKGADGWTQTVRPYEAQIRAAGGNPQQYVGQLLQTAHALAYAPDHQKGEILANIILQYGSHLLQQDANGNSPLDQMLVTKMQAMRSGQPQQQRQQDFRDPRLDQFFAQQEQQKAAEADEVAGGFAEAHEFFADVAPTMADILDTWKAQGKQAITEADLERAYQLSCNLNDDVRGTMEQREAAQAVATVQTATQKARTASSSVRNQPAAASAAQPVGRRSALEAAYDELDR